MLERFMIRQVLFRLDPERAHTLTMRGLRVLSRMPGADRARARRVVDDPRLSQEILGLRFSNPVGLAAGLDKQAEAIPVWARLGFGFTEVGTVTAESQPGNPKPRVFRLREDEALINRFGFNSDGSEEVARRLARVEMSGRAHGIPLGINIGKSKLAEDAEADYLTTFGRVAPYADYVTVNVSSPNTPGLRDLQERSALEGLLSRLAAVNRTQRAPRPILVKVAPDLDDDALDAIVDLAAEHVQGIIISNTTLSRDGLRSRHRDETGGLSGRPVYRRSTDLIRRAHARAPRFPIIGVGGIFSGADAWEKITAGACLVQVYTGFVYQGPKLITDSNRELVRFMEREGITTLADAVGIAVDGS